MPKVTRIEPQKRRKARVNVFLDEQFAFGLSEAVLARTGLRVGDVLTAADREHIEQGEVRAEVFGRATHLLGLRPHGEKELRTKLARGDYGPPVIDAVIEELKRLDYLNDAAFARAKARDAARVKRHGSRRAVAELRQVGVDEATAQAAVGEVYGDHDDVAVARNLVAKRLPGLQRHGRDVARRRLYGMLARRGFEPEQISEAIDAECEGVEW